MKFLEIMRPAHWIKNVFIFAALVFGKKLFVPYDEMLVTFGSAVGAFFCFCLASSAIYIFNDIIDRKADALHPEKSKRPIASGEISIYHAITLSFLCAIVAIIGSFELAPSLTFVILVYIAMMIGYTLLFKRMLILDCIIISIGFCLRAIAGAIVVGVEISPWLLICTFALCLFMAFSKRRSEIAILGENGESFRQTLAGYTPELLAHMLDVTSGLAVLCFLLYSMDKRTIETFGTNNFVYTTPLVLYCVFRFSALIQKGIYHGPVELIIKDLPFQIGFLLWGLSCLAIIYAGKIGLSLGGIWAY
jgi:4-hydroxybenzoate polyprenyltransferase